jgi:hypothetical protein
LCCKGSDSKVVAKNKTHKKDSDNSEFEKLCNSNSDKLPTPNRFKHNVKEENKSYESSSKVSAFPAVHMDNKDALKNILKSIPINKGLIKKHKEGLTIPADKSNRKGKSFSKETDKLETKQENKTDQAKNKIANNHQSFGPYVHRRFTFKFKTKNKITGVSGGNNSRVIRAFCYLIRISTLYFLQWLSILNCCQLEFNVIAWYSIDNHKSKYHRSTFTKNIPPLIKFKPFAGRDDDTDETKNYREGKNDNYE